MAIGVGSVTPPRCEKPARDGIVTSLRLCLTCPPGGPQGTAPAEAGRSKDSEKPDELSELKQQIAAMQRKIDSMG